MKKDKHISNVSNVSIDLSNKLSNNQSKGGIKMTKSVFKKVFATAMALGIAATAYTTQSFAAETGSTVEGGSLTGGAIGFSPLSTTLDGSEQIATASWTIGDIIDARGTGAGWDLTLNLTQFKEVDAAGQYVADGKSIAMNSLFVSTAPTVEKIDASSSDAATITPVAENAALDNESDVKILSAAQDGGMGSYSVSNLGVSLVIPANAYAKTYKSDATVTLNTAP